MVHSAAEYRVWRGACRPRVDLVSMMRMLQMSGWPQAEQRGSGVYTLRGARPGMWGL